MTIKRFLKQVTPRWLYRAAKTSRQALSGNRRLSAVDRAARIAALAGPVRGRTEGWVEVFKELEKLGLHLYPVHFYSPIPDTQELAATRHRWWRETDMSVARYCRAEEARLNRVMTSLRDEFAALPSERELHAAGWGPGYGPIEAMLLHGVLRDIKPARMIEVGSGVSTLYAAAALAANAREGRGGTLTCVEPHPSALLKRSCPAAELIEKAVQDVKLEFFGQLGAGDVLFIDSTHTVRVGSDVNYLLLDVLPSLAAGVIVHVHDIPFPYVTPREYWLFDSLMFWQEPVLLKALLTHNDTLQIIYCASHLYFKDPAALAAAFPGFDPQRHFPSSIWLRKTR